MWSKSGGFARKFRGKKYFRDTDPDSPRSRRITGLTNAFNRCPNDSLIYVKTMRGSSWRCRNNGALTSDTKQMPLNVPTGPVCIRNTHNHVYWGVTGINRDQLKAINRRCHSYETFSLEHDDKKDSFRISAAGQKLECDESGVRLGSQGSEFKLYRPRDVDPDQHIYAISCSSSNNKVWLRVNPEIIERGDPAHLPPAQISRFHIMPQPTPSAWKTTTNHDSTKLYCISNETGYWTVNDDDNVVVQDQECTPFLVEPFDSNADSTQYKIKNMQTGQYLSCEPNNTLRANRNSAGAWEKFDIRSHQNGYAFRCVSHHRGHDGVEYGAFVRKSPQGNQLIHDAYVADEDAAWFFVDREQSPLVNGVIPRGV